MIWGTGINGKVSDFRYRAKELDIRAVRGPLTRSRLESWGFEVPEVYGDPAVLLPELISPPAVPERSQEYVVVPNLNDEPSWRGLPGLISPRQELSYIISKICQSEFVVGSSLHAMVLADAYGVPSVLVRSKNEPPFKYEDYYRGTGQGSFVSKDSVDDAIAEARAMLRSNAFNMPNLDSVRARLRAAFPTELWTRTEGDG
ncbi:polysaccharide pyruvyl transferase family protein [Microbacterium barkeri]